MHWNRCNRARYPTKESIAQRHGNHCMGLIIRSSAIHAAGCYTTTRIAKGRRVAEYTGLLITKDQADTLYEESPVTYLFGLGDGSVVIDGHCSAMFINHSCDPNCESSEEDGRVWVTAIKNIAAGAEITYDYCLYDGGDEEALCNCGTTCCRGTMYSPTEVRKRKVDAKKAGNTVKKQPQSTGAAN
jgi:SET domain-containing protein